MKTIKKYTKQEFIKCLELSELARMIENDWSNVSPHAQPYLKAMRFLKTINDYYLLDSGSEIVLRFLSNAKGWRGETAKLIKEELKRMVNEDKDLDVQEENCAKAYGKKTYGKIEWSL